MRLYKNWGDLMRYLSLFILLFMLVGCGTTEEQTNGSQAEKSKEEVVQDESTENKENDVKELTDEDKRFIELIEKGDYQTIIDETAGFGSDSQVNFYFLAYAFNSVPDYKLSQNYLDRAKYIPAEIEDKVKKLKEEIAANVVDEEGA